MYMQQFTTYNNIKHFLLLRNADTLQERNRKIVSGGEKSKARFILDNRTQIAAELAGLWIKGRDRGDSTLQIRQKFLHYKTYKVAE
jgi:hypothetical protein